MEEKTFPASQMALPLLLFVIRDYSDRQTLGRLSVVFTEYLGGLRIHLNKNNVLFLVKYWFRYTVNYHNISSSHICICQYRYI